MLPSSEEIKNNTNKAKFADTGLELLINMMISIGANKKVITAKIAGGSQMFNFNSNSDILKVGQRNILATKKKLQELKVPIIGDDTGGNYGRTIELSAEDGSLLIRTIGHGIQVI